MFANLLEFAGNHWDLVGAFIGAVLALYIYESRKQGKTLTPQELVGKMNRDKAVVLDLRDQKDFRLGHITHAKNLPYNELQTRLGELAPMKEQPLVVVCSLGQYSGAAAKTLHQLGFKDVLRLSGGMSAWTAQGLPVVKGAKR